MNQTEVSLDVMDGNIVYGTLTQPKFPDAAVIMVHGITADRHEWGLFDKIVEKLYENNIATLAIDYRGHGKSVTKMKELTLSGIYMDITISMTYLRKHFEKQDIKYFLISNSFGGGVSYIYSSFDDDLSGACFCSPVFSYINDLTRVNENWVTDSNKNCDIDYAGNRLQRYLPDEMMLFDQLINRFKAKSNMIIVHGDADTDVPVIENKQFAISKNIPIKIFNNMGHGFAAPYDFDLNTEQTQRNHLVVSEFLVKYLRSIINA